MTKDGLKVGFIGLGIMGAPMALNLLKAGHTLFVASRSKVPTAFAEAGATVCTNAMEVAKRADIVITMVPDTPHVEDVLFGEHGVAHGLELPDMSSPWTYAAGFVLATAALHAAGYGLVRVLPHAAAPLVRVAGAVSAGMGAWLMVG